MAVALRGRQDPRRGSLQAGKDLHGCCGERYNLCARFGGGQPKATTIKIHPFPFEAQDLAFTAASEHEEPDCGYHGLTNGVLLLQDREGVGERDHLPVREEPLTLLNLMELHPPY